MGENSTDALASRRARTLSTLRSRLAMRTASASSFRRAASASTRALYFSALEGDDASFVEPDAAAAGVVDAEGAEGGFFEAISAGAEACSGLAARELAREFARESARLRLRRREDPPGGGFPPPPRSRREAAA